jgi:DNA polymerase III subunit delta'
MFEDFFGNGRVVNALEEMIAQERIAQTLLLAGPAGVGKATLARRFAARLLGGKEKIEKDDLSLPDNLALVEEREKWAADQRAQDPLLFASHSDFVTFPPEGPLRQISIQQMRLLKERAQFKPLKGNRRVFLIDQLDRAGEQAANSLLKTLEEPPDHLILIVTAENAHDLLPTIRSRAVPLYLAPLQPDEMREFVLARRLAEPERRIELAGGSPGLAVSLDLAAYQRRREAMFVLLQVSAGVSPFSSWLQYSDSVAPSKQDKLDSYLKVLYSLLADVLAIHQNGGAIRNSDLRDEMEELAAKVSFDWIRTAVAKVDELLALLRRNIQKSIALDAFALELRP